MNIFEEQTNPSSIAKKNSRGIIMSKMSYAKMDRIKSELNGIMSDPATKLAFELTIAKDTRDLVSKVYRADIGVVK